MRGLVFTMLVVGTAIGAVMPAKQPAAEVAPLASTTGKPVAEPPRPTLLERDFYGHFIAHAEVNGQPVRFLVDTGADMVALTLEDARKARVFFDPGSFQVIGSGASGAVRGQQVTLDNVVLDGKRVYGVKGAVVEGLDISLLGQSYLRKIKSVHLTGDTMRLE
jgi:aspartyl protease family protein